MPHLGTVLRIVDIDGTEHRVTRSGLFYSYGDKATGPVPLTLIQDAARIPDFGRNLKRPAAIMERCRQQGLSYETRYDAAHGRRYLLCVYGGAPFSPEREMQRRVTLAAADGITDLKSYLED